MAQMETDGKRQSLSHRTCLESEPRPSHQRTHSCGLLHKETVSDSSSLAVLLVRSRLSCKKPTEED